MLKMIPMSALLSGFLFGHGFEMAADLLPLLAAIVLVYGVFIAL